MSARDVPFDEEVAERGGSWAHVAPLAGVEAARDRIGREFDRVVAALYIDPRGPYPKIPNVEAWDEARDATTYGGPHPVVVHPPCGPWGALRGLCKYQRRDLAPLAVRQVRTWGGVLEHPRGSLLWQEADLRLPRPGCEPDEHGGVTVAVEQVAWGHVCRKPTWLYVVGVDLPTIQSGILTGGTPTHRIASKARRGDMLAPSSAVRRRTPPAFAEWLVSLARKARK